MTADFSHHMEAVALMLLGEPNRALSGKTELRWGNKGSMSVDLQKGTWFDNEEGVGGGVLDLLQAYKGLDKAESVDWLVEQGFIPPHEDHPPEANGSAGKFAGFMDDHPIAIYDYHDDRGDLAYQVLKFAKSAPRRFMQRRPHPDGGWIWGLQEGLYGKIRSGDWFKAKTGKKYEATAQFPEAGRWLYRRAEVIEARDAGRVVVLCEGEKDAETVREWGFCATTNAGGAKYWSDQFDEDLAGADVVIAPDNDSAGQQRALTCGAALRDKAARVRVLDLASVWPDIPVKADVTDWKEQAGGDAEQFGILCQRAPEWRSERPRSSFGAFTFEDVGLGIAPQQDWIIDGWIPEHGRSIIGGPSQSGKSFLAIHMAMSICRGQDFFSWPCRRGTVIYQAGEGGHGIEDRFRAYKNHFEVQDDEAVPLAVLPAKVNLFRSDSGDIDKLIAEAKSWALYFDEPLRLIVIDTLSTATTGSDENSGRDMGLVLQNIARIEEECGCHVCLVHHMNAEGRKLRGHTSIHANIDTAIFVTSELRTKIRTAVLQKQKDGGEDGIELNFALESLKVRESNWTGRDITSCVVVTVDEKERMRRERDKQGLSPTPIQRRILMNYFEALNRYGQFIASTDEGPADAVGRQVVDYRHYKEVALERMPEEEDRTKAGEKIRKEFERAKDEMMKRGMIGLKHPYMWWAGKPIRGFPNTFGFSDNYGTNTGQMPDNPHFDDPDLFPDGKVLL